MGNLERTICRLECANPKVALKKSAKFSRFGKRAVSMSEIKSKALALMTLMNQRCPTLSSRIVENCEKLSFKSAEARKASKSQSNALDVWPQKEQIFDISIKCWSRREPDKSSSLEKVSTLWGNDTFALHQMKWRLKSNEKALKIELISCIDFEISKLFETKSNFGFVWCFGKFLTVDSIRQTAFRTPLPFGASYWTLDRRLCALSRGWNSFRRKSIRNY